MHRDPLWIIVACRQIKKKQESTGTDIDTRGGGGRGRREGEVSKHVEQLVKRRGKMLLREEVKVHPRASHESVNECVHNVRGGRWRMVGVRRQVPCVIMCYNGRGI